MTDAPQNGAARPMSRRARREAERSAEREAFLTGQQPLLTRREMRRLREEQEALREAVASGELTVDEAQALQSPMAEMDIKSHTLHEHNSFEPIREPLLGSGPGDGPSRANAAPSATGFPSAPSAPAASAPVAAPSAPGFPSAPSAPAASAPVAAPSAPVVTPGDDLRDTRVVPTAASRMPEGAGHTTAPTFPPVNTAAANTANAANGGNGPAVGLPTHLASSSPTAGSAASFGISAASATSAGAGPLGGQAPTQPVVHVNSAHAGAPSLPTYPARSRRAASAASAGMASSASAYSSLSAPSAAPAVNGRATRRRANAASAPSSFSATAASATAASADLASRAGTRSRRRAAASAASAPSIFSATAASADLAGVNAVSARSAASAPSAFSATAPSAMSGTAASAASANSAVSDLGADLPRRRTVFNAVSAPTPSAAPRAEAAPASPFLPVHSVLENPPAQLGQSAHSAELPVAQSAPQAAPAAPAGGEQGPLWQSVAADRTQPVPSADEAGDWNVSTAAYAPVNEPLADAKPTPGQVEPAPMRRRSLLGGNAQPAPTPAPAANETPARRPIVRAPSVAKGVREVDTNTGELTIIKPANPNPPVVQRTPEMVSTQDEFENEVVPNWGAFSQARANQQANSAPNEALADTGLYDHLEDDESSQDGRGLRIFLTMLLIIVLALVVAAVVWFVVLDGGSTNALALELPKLE